MKKRVISVVLAVSAFMAISVASELDSFQSNQLEAETLNKKITIDQFEKVRIGNHTLTSLDAGTSKNFLSDELIGNDSSWETAVANSAAWKTTGGFTSKEQAKIVSKLATTTNIPATDAIANEAIGDVSERWWLSDAVGKYGTPKGYVDVDRKINNGYTRSGATVVSGACSLGDVKEAGGLPTKAQTLTSEKVNKGLMFRAFPLFLNYSQQRIAHSLYDNATCTGTPLATINVGLNLGDINAVGNQIAPVNNQEEWAKDKNIAQFIDGQTILNGDQNLAGPEIKTSCTRIPYYNGSGMIASPFYAKAASYYTEVNGYARGSLGMGTQACPGGSVVAQNAAIRPMVELDMTSVFSALTTVDTSVSETMGTYPEAGNGPYTLQMNDAGLKVSLDSSNKNVSGAVLKYPTNDVETGKVSIPYDVSGSTYDASSTSYITAMKDGKYAKLGIATQNGKGTVTIDINDYVTKTDGKITPQEITISLFQEEITPDGYTNYISNELPITIEILDEELTQTPELSITNNNSVTYGDAENKLQVATAGGQGDGTITYEIESGVEFATVNESGLISIIKPGVFTIKATKSGGDIYKDSIATKEITINQRQQSDLTIANEDFLIDSALNFTVLVTGRPSSLTSDLTYAITAGQDNASIVGNVITPIKPGKITISVSSTGDIYWADKTITKEIEITQLPNQSPTLSITNTADIVYDDANTTFTIELAGGQGDGEVRYELTKGEEFASIDADQVTIKKPGAFTIQVTKDGNGSYQNSIATKEFVVDKATQSEFDITNTDFTMKSDAMTFEITTSGRPQTLIDPITYELISGEEFASLNEGTITAIKEGAITISATSKGNTFYKDCTVEKTISINELPEQNPVIAISNADTVVYDEANKTLEISTTGGEGDGKLTYFITSGNDVATIDENGIVSILNVGQFEVEVVKAGDSIYKDSVAKKTITISKAEQSDFKITNSDFTMKSDAMTFEITTSGRPQTLTDPITYELTSGEEYASISEGTVTAIKEGTIKITATSKGNAFYKDCTVEKTININELPEQNPVIAISNADTVAYNETNKTLVISTTGGEGNGKLAYAITSGNDVATIDENGIVSILSVGQFEVEVVKAGDSIYKDSSAKKAITITKGEQSDFTITNTDFLINSATDFAITTMGRPKEVTGSLSYRLSKGEGTIATLNNDHITPITTGEIEIEVTSPASDNYNSKVVKKTIMITDLPAQEPVLTITNDNVVWGDNSNKMSITTTGGQGSGEVTYDITQGKDSVASIKGTDVTILKSGKFTILAKKSGNGIYGDSEISKEIIVAKKAITIKPKKITKKENQMWSSVTSNGYDVIPSLVSGDILQGTPVYGYGTGVNDQSPAGNYATVISGLSNENYTISYEEGILLVEKDRISIEDALTFYRIKSGTLGNNGWYTSDVILESLKKNGYDLLSNTTVFTSSEITINTQGIQDINVSFKHKNGTITEPIIVPLKIDKEKPVMNEIVLKEKNTGVLAKFINALSFGNWFKEEIVAEMSATDNLSEEFTYQYQEEVNGVLGAVKTTTGSLSYGNESNVILHVKAIDEAGNISSQAVQSPKIQVDLDAPKITGVSNDTSYYLPKLVVISDENSGIDVENTYYISSEKKELHEQSLFKGEGTIQLYVQDNAGNVTECTFTMKGLPPIDTIKKDDASRKIVSDVQKEYDEIKDKLNKDEQQVIEEWLANAKEQSKKQVEQIKEPDSGIIVDGNGGAFDEDIQLVVEIITSEIQMEEIELGAVNGLEADDEIKEAFDIYLKKGNDRIQPSGKIRVKIPYTETMKTYENLRVVYIDDNKDVSIYPHTIETEYVVFETDHFSQYAVTGKIKKINIDTDDDGNPDINIDVNDDGKADLNIDTDDDGIPDINVDTDVDGKADFNIDMDNDGSADINIGNPQNPWKATICGTANNIKYCSDGVSKPYLNIDSDKDGKADINIDFNKDKLPDLNIDDDLNKIPELDIDTNGDGKPDVNVDENQDGKADKFIKEITNWKPNADYTYEGFKYDTDDTLAYEPKKDDVKDPSLGDDSSNIDGDTDQKDGSEQNGSSKDSTTVKGAYTGDERNWNQWWLFMVGSTVLMVGSYLLRRKLKHK